MCYTENEKSAEKCVGAVYIKKKKLSKYGLYEPAANGIEKRIKKIKIIVYLFELKLFDMSLNPTFFFMLCDESIIILIHSRKKKRL